MMRGRMMLLPWTIVCLGILIRTVVDAAKHKSKLIFADDPNEAVVGSYIVVFDRETSEEEVEETLTRTLSGITGVIRERRFRSALNAVTLRFEEDMNEEEDDGDKDDDQDNGDDGSASESNISSRRDSDERKMKELLKDDRVSFIEENQRVQATENQSSPPSWGLDRIDQAVGLDNHYQYSYTGKGVDVYILDGGILSTHTDLTPRVSCGFNYFEGTEACDESNTGHGTHVAGTLAGTVYGVAKEATIINCKVLDNEGDGSWEGVIAGVDYAISRHLSTQNPQKPNLQRAAVMNLSLGGGVSEAMNQAVDNAANVGNMVVVAAAGNQDKDACDGSPASAGESVLTVAATDDQDRRADFSNYGNCVDLFAPGEDIVSAGINSNTAQKTKDGTSMSAPHVAGVAALYMESNFRWTAAEIRQFILDEATPNVVSDTRGSPNAFINTLRLQDERSILIPPAGSPPGVANGSPTNAPTGSPAGGSGAPWRTRLRAALAALLDRGASDMGNRI